MARAAALLLTVLTGFSGLVYEVAWQKYLATLLGSQSEATAAILGLFLGGLSLGYALLGAWTRRLVSRAERRGRPPRLLFAYGWVESGIGAYALAFPWLFRGVQALSFSIPHAPGGAGFFLDVGLAALLVLPPTILMGGTIPILTQALSQSLHDATRFHSLVYALNTTGAFFGALCAGFFLLPSLGLARAMDAMAAVNLFAGMVFLVLGRRGRPLAAAPTPVPAARPPGFAAYAAVALLSGFAMMAIQTVLNRVGALAFGASQFTFSMVVASFVLCIALGSFAVSALPRIGPRLVVASQWALVVLLALLYRVLPDATYWAYVLRTFFGTSESDFIRYYAYAFAVMLVVLALPIGLSGALLPLLFHQLRRDVDDLGGVAGRLYSWNTLGSLLGALLGGYVLLSFFDLHHVYRIAMASLVLAAAILAARLLPARPLSVAALMVAPALLGIALLPAWDPLHLSAGFFRQRARSADSYVGPQAAFAILGRNVRVRFYDDDPTSSVAVWEPADPKASLARSIINNGKSDGSTSGDLQTVELLAMLPALFSDGCGRALVVGYGTGITAGELAALPCMHEVVVTEISSGVVEAAPYFDFANHDASRSPKLRLVRSDAYRWLRRGTDRFDVIVSEPSNPWMTGVEMLYAREFLEAARTRLAPGGVYAQWIHRYEIDDATLALVLRTYAAVFDHVAVWDSSGVDLILLGFTDGERPLDLARLAARTRQPEVVSALHRGGIDGLPALLAHELLPLGVLNAAGLTGDQQTLLHPVLNDRAARAFFRGGFATLPFTGSGAAARIGARNSLVQRLARTRPDGLDASTWSALVRESCRAPSDPCATLAAAWQHAQPGSPELAALLAELRARPELRALLAQDALEALGTLLGNAPPAAGPVSLEQARAATERFTRRFSHAAPFSPTALRAIWARCEGRDGACAAEAAETERWLTADGATVTVPGTRSAPSS